MFERIRNLVGKKDTPTRVELAPDQVWISASARSKGVRKEVEQSVAAGARMVALVAHFPDVLDDLETIAGEFAADGSVRAVLARQLTPDSAARTPLAASDTMHLIVAEHHPLKSHDTKLVQFAEALPCRSRLVFHVSLDDAVLKLFGGERIRPLLERMGAPEDEPITHALVTRSIEKAQEKIEASAMGDADAGSAAAWLERNTRQ